MDLFGQGRAGAYRAAFDDGTYPSGFWTWLEDNEHILEAFIRLARRTRKAGVARWSADAICHVLRWQTAIRERGAGTLKINDHCTAGLARLTMRLCPDLAGFFETRTPPARAEARRLDGSTYGETA